jgi:uncharacterized membrane protein
MSIATFLLLAVFAYLAYLGATTLTVPAVIPASSAIDGAAAIAGRRLARGEIDAHDYERIVAALAGGAPRYR